MSVRRDDVASCVTKLDAQPRRANESICPAEIAQGRVWSGTDAKKVGLVDEIGGLNDAIAYAAQTAKLGKDWELEEYPVVEGWEEKLIKQVVGSKEAKALQHQDPLTTEFIRIKSELNTLQSLNDPRGIYVRLPFTLKID